MADTTQPLTAQALFGSAPPPPWAQTLIDYLESVRREVAGMRGRLGISDMAWDYKTARFSHGKPVALSTNKVLAPKGVLVLSADGAVVDYHDAKPSSVAQKMNVTVFFVDPSAVNINVALLILPDGVASGK